MASCHDIPISQKPHKSEKLPLPVTKLPLLVKKCITLQENILSIMSIAMNKKKRFLKLLTDGFALFLLPTLFLNLSVPELSWSNSMKGGISESVSLTKSEEKHWYEEETPTDATLFSLFFFDTDIGWAVGGDTYVPISSPGFARMLYTEDGGQTWEEKSIDGLALSSIHFTNNTQGWTVGMRETIRHTHDEGQTWQKQEYDTDYFDESLSAYTAHIDIAAPARRIVTLYGSDVQDTTMAFGTSFAAPYVSSVIGLILSIQPNIKHQEIYDILTKTADDVPFPDENPPSFNDHPDTNDDRKWNGQGLTMKNAKTINVIASILTDIYQ